jgi:hypothetical protein
MHFMASEKEKANPEEWGIQLQLSSIIKNWMMPKLK